FQVRQCPSDVRHFCDRQMLTCPGGNFRDGSSNASCATLGDHNSICARGIGGAENCAQVVRILDAGEHDHKRVLAALGGEHIIEVAVRFGRSDRNHSLVCVVPSHAIKLSARNEAHCNTDSAGFLQNALQAKIVPVLCDSEPFEGAATCLEG